MKRIAIIGGGISGLTAAFALEEQRRAGVPLQYVLFESAPRLGGVLVTERVDGCLVEAGADSFLTEKPWAADLCRRVGLGDQLIGSNDAARKTYILVKGKLVAIPDGLMFMVPTRIRPILFSPLFSFGTKLSMAREWFYPRNRPGDESVASFVERHYGAEMVDRLADPLLISQCSGCPPSLRRDGAHTWKSWPRDGGGARKDSPIVPRSASLHFAKKWNAGDGGRHCGSPRSFCAAL
jgi:oxygen-dependent protoporphyrinogen oxidase